MTRALPLPMRVLVKGASTVVVTSHPSGPTEDFTLPRAVEAALVAGGQPARVQTAAVPSERAAGSLRQWQREALAFSPDAIVLGYGFYETIHTVLPWWLERHANSARGRPGRWRELYRTRLLRPVWVSLAKLQVRLDPRLSTPLFRGHPERVAADLRALVRHFRSVGSPLVVLLEAHPPTGKAAGWFPGMAARIDTMNAAVASMVATLDDPEVRVFPTSTMLDRYRADGIDPTPDGFHFSADVHRELGAAVGAELLAWARTQPHLGTPAIPA